MWGNARQHYESKLACLSLCCDVILTVASVLLFQTLSVSMLLRYSHHQIFVFIGKYFLCDLGYCSALNVEQCRAWRVPWPRVLLVLHCFPSCS